MHRLEAQAYLDWSDGYLNPRNQFDVGVGLFYHPALLNQAGGNLDDAIITSLETNPGNMAAFNLLTGEAIEDQLVLWGDDRLQAQADLLTELATLNDVIDPLVAHACPAPTGGSGVCISNRRMELQGELAAYGVVDFLTPYSPEGLAIEIAGMGTGTLTKVGGKLMVRVGDKLIDFAEDTSGSVRVLGNGAEDVVDATKGGTGADNVATYNKLKAELTAEEIAQGHAYDKHVVQGREFEDLGITERYQFQDHVEYVINNPSDVRYYTDGRTVYLDAETRTVVIRNPGAGESTAFRPAEIDYNDYVGTLPTRTEPY